MSRSSEIVLSDSWFVSSIWFLLSTGQVAIGTCGISLPVCEKCSVVVFARQQLHCPTAATLPGQLLPQQGGAIQF
jgi:hypothetical protein